MQKIAIVHDQLQEYGGAERVVVALKHIFPEADVYTAFYTPEKLGVHREQFKNWKIITSWVDKLPLLKRSFSPFRFMLPWLWESFDFTNYDMVISSSAWFMCKGVITRPETLHICYLHNPPRSCYFYETAVEWQKYLLFRIYGAFINHDLRQWDYISSQRVDYFIANSYETQRRIEKFYRRDATVIYPPVKLPKLKTTLQSPMTNEKSKYYIIISRLARAKHIEVLIKAANTMNFPLKIVGTGRDESYLKSIAGKTVEFLGVVSDKDLPTLYEHAKAFLFAARDEEFGIAPVEALGYGVPVVAYASGGVLETVKEGENGFLFHDIHENSLIEKIKLLEKLTDEEYINLKKRARQSAEQYSFEHFKEKILQFVLSKKKR